MNSGPSTAQLLTEAFTLLPSPTTAMVTTGPAATGQPKESPVELVWSITGDPNPFLTPDGLALDQQGNLYVMDSGNGRIQKFDSNGQFITKLDTCGEGEHPFIFSASGVAIDAQGNLYVNDLPNMRICKYDSNGSFINQWDGSGNAKGRLDTVGVILVDQQGNVYVAELFINRVLKFRQRQG